MAVPITIKYESCCKIAQEYEPIYETHLKIIITNKGILNDILFKEIRSKCEKTLDSRIRSDIIRGSLFNVARRVYGRHELINSLPKWDGIDRIEQLSNCFTEVPSKTKKVSLYRKLQFFLCRSILRWQDGTHNYVLTLLNSRNYIGKTTFARWFGETWKDNPYYYTAFSTEKRPPLLTRTRLATRNEMVREVTDLAEYSIKEAYSFRTIVTSECMDDRDPYTKYSVEYTPLTVFIASINQNDGMFCRIKDRIFIVVNFMEINLKYNIINRQQLLAQAKELVETNKEIIDLTVEEVATLIDENSTYMKI